MIFRHDHNEFLCRYLLLGFIPWYSGCSGKQWKDSMKKFKEDNPDGALHQFTFTFPLGFEMLSYNTEQFSDLTT